MSKASDTDSRPGCEDWLFVTTEIKALRGLDPSHSFGTDFPSFFPDFLVE
ncbi:MAG: hypothetical protein OXC18_13270 [Desulfurellaceae bacterium]|nr:hypothetical protein [Desulfurellaceae bacterium]